MPGPTTEILNDEVKGLRDDLHKVELDVRELSTQVKGIITSIKLLAVLAVSTLGASIWWGATLTADVRNLGSKMDEKFKAVDARFDKLDASINARFDKLDASIARALDPARPPATKPTP